MKKIKPKKKFGQNFMLNKSTAESIVKLINPDDFDSIIEVGPGKGILTQFLLNLEKFWVSEIDGDIIEFLKNKFDQNIKIIEGDFLKINLNNYFSTQRNAIIGNFPYNISSQILFKILENRDKVSLMVGMFQKEVAQRIVSPSGNKNYGILSVLTQAFYDTEYCLDISNEEFYPKPKVQSAVIKISRKENFVLDCDEKLFFKIVKLAFNQRRKKLSNSLKKIEISTNLKNNDLLNLRAERLEVKDFVYITKNSSLEPNEI